MKIAIMQPYFFPYIGYFQLMNAVDEFIIYDNIEYTKKGWVNRNKILVNGKASYVTLPLKKDSDYLDIRDRYLADVWASKRNKILNRISGAYRDAPFFDFVYPLIKYIILFEDDNLFSFIQNSLFLINKYLGIKTPLLVSSTLSIDHDLKAEKKVIEICKTRGAGIYINPIGGLNLYRKDKFKDEGVELFFIRASDLTYKQFDNDFVPFLSIIDIMMFNSTKKIQEYLNSFYSLV
jgi:hypothetical protein